MNRISDFDVINISASDVIQAAEFTYVESDWTICINGIKGTAIEINRKTGETRPYDYEKALKEMFP